MNPAQALSHYPSMSTSKAPRRCALLRRLSVLAGKGRDSTAARRMRTSASVILRRRPVRASTHPSATTRPTSPGAATLPAAEGFTSPSALLCWRIQFMDNKLPGAFIAAGGGQGGNSHIISLTVDPVIDLLPTRVNSIYVTGGGGYYYKSTNFTVAECCDFYGYPVGRDDEQLFFKPIRRKPGPGALAPAGRSLRRWQDEAVRRSAVRLHPHTCDYRNQRAGHNGVDPSNVWAALVDFYSANRGAQWRIKAPAGSAPIGRDKWALTGTGRRHLGGESLECWPVLFIVRHSPG